MVIRPEGIRLAARSTAARDCDNAKDRAASERSRHRSRHLRHGCSPLGRLRRRCETPSVPGVKEDRPRTLCRNRGDSVAIEVECGREDK